MADAEKTLSTRELWARLFRSPDIDQFLAENRDSFDMPSFSEYISRLAEIKGEKPERIILRGNLEKSFGHRLFSGSRKPSRDTVLQLAFGFELSADDTQYLLKAARMTALHPKVKRDAVIAYCLFNHKSLIETQYILLDNGLPTIGEMKE